MDSKVKAQDSCNNSSQQPISTSSSSQPMIQSITDGDNSDIEIEFIGGNMSVLSNMPHQREACDSYK